MLAISANSAWLMRMRKFCSTAHNQADHVDRVEAEFLDDARVVGERFQSFARLFLENPFQNSANLFALHGFLPT